MTKFLIFLLLLGHISTAQWIDKGQVITEIGALPPFGINLKAGYAFQDNVVAGLFTEHHNLFTRRNEAGIFFRKYMLDTKKFNAYLHGAASAGQYNIWFWGFDKFHREQMRGEKNFTALRFIGGGGVNYRLTNRLALGHEAALGVTNRRNRFYPSFLFTLNYRFGKAP